MRPLSKPDDGTVVYGVMIMERSSSVCCTFLRFEVSFAPGKFCSNQLRTKLSLFV